MGTGFPAEGFLRHRGLILTAAGGAVVEGGLLALFAPNARSVAPQVTALPSIAAYHDLRWLFTDTQSQLWFGGLVAAVLVARAALDVTMLRLAWPRGLAAPKTSRAFVSCAALTLVAWVLLSPAVTLAFGAAVLPFSWPFLAAFPLMLGIVAALSHGGVITAWWRRLPPARAVVWLLGSFATATVAAAVITHLSTGEALLVAALTGLVNARAWYGVAVLAARLQPRPHESLPARMLFGLPYAPIAAVMVLAVVVGVARLLFTGTIELPISPANAAPAAALVGSGAGAASGQQAAPSPAAAVADPASAAAGAGFDAGLIGSWIVPVNSSRATPTTRASTITAAMGAYGRPNSILAGSDSCGRGCSRAARTATPYQALALTRPARATTRSASPVGKCVITAAVTVAAAKLPSSHSTARAGGSRRHQAVITPPWLSAATMPSMIGNAARNGQENGKTATPKASVTAGDSSAQASRVSAAHDTNARLILGAGTPRGQASRSIATSRAARATRTAATRPPNHNWD